VIHNFSGLKTLLNKNIYREAKSYVSITLPDKQASMHALRFGTQFKQYPIAWYAFHNHSC